MIFADLKELDFFTKAEEITIVSDDMNHEL